MCVPDSSFLIPDLPLRTHTLSPMHPPLPRGLIFLASLWLVGSWLVAIGIDPPVQPSAASYTPGVRLLLDCILVGVVFAWPMLRLSQPPSTWPVQWAALDALVLAALLQLVLWPMRLVTPWSVARTMGLDLVLLGWVALVGALVAAGGRLDHRGRTMAMGACVLLVFAGPLVGAVAAAAGAASTTVTLLGWLSPFGSLRQLSGGGPAPLTAQEWVAVASGAAIAGVAWAVLGLACVRRSGGDRPRTPRILTDGGIRRPPEGGTSDQASGLPPPEPLSSSHA